MSKYYGSFVYSNCYHGSIRCPVLLRVSKFAESQVAEYPGEKNALARHKRRCQFCLGERVFDIDGYSERVRLSKNQYRTLEIIVEMFSKKGPLTLRDISNVRGRSVVSTYLIVKKLREKGLVEHRLKKDAIRASGRSLAPTKRGTTVVSSPDAKDTVIG